MSTILRRNCGAASRAQGLCDKLALELGATFAPSPDMGGAVDRGNHD
ncbi:MAG TPA: hypothetical protein VF493_14450 [Terriglobales bacterium]